MLPLNQQQANQLLPLISNLEAYRAFLASLDILKEAYYVQLRDSKEPTETAQLQGKLQLIDALKDLRQRTKDAIEDGSGRLPIIG